MLADHLTYIHNIMHVHVHKINFMSSNQESFYESIKVKFPYFLIAGGRAYKCSLICWMLLNSSLIMNQRKYMHFNIVCIHDCTCM